MWNQEALPTVFSPVIASEKSKRVIEIGCRSSCPSFAVLFFPQFCLIGKSHQCKNGLQWGFTGPFCWSQAQDIMTIESIFLRIAVKMTLFVCAVCCFWFRKCFWSFVHSIVPGRCKWETEINNLISCGVQMRNNSRELYGQSGLSNWWLQESVDIMEACCSPRVS